LVAIESLLSTRSTAGDWGQRIESRAFVLAVAAHRCDDIEDRHCPVKYVSARSAVRTMNAE
jgi:hypothetical protein